MKRLLIIAAMCLLPALFSSCDDSDAEVTKIWVDESEITIKVGESRTIDVHWSPSNASKPLIKGDIYYNSKRYSSNHCKPYTGVGNITISGYSVGRDYVDLYANDKIYISCHLYVNVVE